MGSALFISIKDKPDDIDTFMDGKCLARSWNVLDSVALELGIPGITKLCNNAWKSPDKGIPVFEKYLAYVNDHPEKFVQAEYAYLVADLNNVLRLISEAQRLKTKWRLLLDY